jgi:hypothetical protein
LFVADYSIEYHEAAKDAKKSLDRIYRIDKIERTLEFANDCPSGSISCPSC